MVCFAPTTVATSSDRKLCSTLLSLILVSHHHFEIQPNKTVLSPKQMRERCTCLKNCGLHECTCVYLFTNASSYDMVSITKIPYQFFKSCCRNARSASHCAPPGILYYFFRRFFATLLHLISHRHWCLQVEEEKLALPPPMH